MRGMTDLVRRGAIQWKELKTSWTRVRQGKGSGPEARVARASLAEQYMPMVFWLARRLERLRESAADSAQEALMRILEGWIVEDADEGRGRFRSFLSVCLRNFVYRRERGQERFEEEAGEAPVVDAVDASEAEEERLERVRTEAREAALRKLAARPDAVKALTHWLLDSEVRALPLKEAAARLGMTVGQFRYATELARATFAAEVHRLCDAECARGEEG